MPVSVLDATWSCASSRSTAWSEELEAVGRGRTQTRKVRREHHSVLDAVLGRWLRRDPLDYVDGASTYTYYARLSGADPTGLFKPKYHRKITEEAFRGKLSEKCIEIIADACVDQDGGWATNSGPFAEDTNHGDNDKIKETVKRMKDRLKSAIMPCEECDCEGFYKRLKKVGKALHALQDLYAHSNYVEEYAGGNDGSGPSECSDPPPLWDFDNNPRPPGVITGTFEWTIFGGSGTHDKYNKDHPDSPRGGMTGKGGRSNFRIAKSLAQRHSNKIADEFLSGLPESCLALLRKCCPDE